MLLRAICYDISTEDRDSKFSESVVFVEAHTRAAAVHKLTAALALIWNIREDQVEFYNLNSEAEIYEQSLSERGDIALFETSGCGGKPTYTSELPILLVTPPMHARLMRAFQLLPYYGNPTVMNDARGKPFMMFAPNNLRRIEALRDVLAECMAIPGCTVEDFKNRLLQLPTELQP